MKKFLRIVCLTLVVAMLLPMTPVELFATETNENQTQNETGEGTVQSQSDAIDQLQITPKADYTNPEFYTDASGNRIYLGQQIALVENAEVADDFDWGGTVYSEDYKTLSERQDGTTGANGIGGLTPVNLAPRKTGASAGPGTVNIKTATLPNGIEIEIEDQYFVGYDDEYIYLTVRETSTTKDVVVDEQEYLQWLNRTIYVLRIGFNPNDYSQILTTSGINFNASYAGTIINPGASAGQELKGGGLTSSYLPKANGLTPIADLKVGKFMFSSNDAMWNALGSETGGYNYNAHQSRNEYYRKSYSTYFSYKLSKADIAKAWDDAFADTANPTNYYNDNGTPDDVTDDIINLPNAFFISGGGSIYIYNGIAGDDSAATSLGAANLLHNASILTEAQCDALGNDCTVLPDVIVLETERNVGACAEGCTFAKNVNDALKFTNEDGTSYYYTSCATCGTVGYKTFTKCEATGTHSYVDRPAKAATCIAPAISAHQYCTECGATEGGTTSGSPLRWVSGTSGNDYSGGASYAQTFHVAGAATVVSGDLNWTIVDDPETDKNEKSSNAKGVVSLVSGIEPIKVTNKYIASHYAGNYQSTMTNGTYYNNAPADSQADADKIPDCEYYIVEDNNSIYITIRLAEKTWGESDTDCIKDSRYWIWIGLNPDDYSQAVNINLGASKSAYTIVGFNDSQTPSMKTASANDWLVNSLFARYGYKSDGTESSSLNSYTNYAVSTSPFVKYMSFEIDKAKIAYYWDEIYGTDFYNDNGTEEDLTDDSYNLSNAVFVGVSARAEAFTDDTAAFRYTMGVTSVPKTYANAWGTKSVFLPDVVILGEEKEIPGCSFIAHNIDYKYLVPGTTDTYYHSCINCGASGIRTFKADMYGLVYDQENATLEGAIKTPATCESEGVGIKSCSCGKLDPSEKATFAIPVIPHDFVEVIDNKYLVKAATCIAGAQYYKSCSDCGATGEIFTTAPLRWSTGERPASAIDYSALYALGQNAYIVGSEAKVADTLKPEDLEYGLNYKKGLTFKDSDAVLVDVTGEGNKVKSILTTGGAATSMMTTAPNVVAQSNSDFVDLPEADYYVAYNSDYVFLTIREVGGTYTNINDQVMNTQRLGSVNIRIGFNPANPNQYINLTNNVSADIAFGGFYNNGTKVTSGFGTILEGGISRKYVVATENDGTGANGNNVGYGATGKYVTYHTVVLNKAELANAYNTAFGVHTYTKETLPNTMFVSLYGTPTNQRGGAFNSSAEADADYKSKSGKSYQMAYGLTELETAFNGVYTIPDLIVLGEEKGLGCTFEKDMDDAHKVTNADGTYYYYTSCELCDSEGAVTFTNCEIEGEHSYIVVPAKAPTCIAPGYTSHKICEVCGERSDDYEIIPPTRYLGDDVIKIDHTALQAYDQIVYTTGDNAVLPNDFTWADLDGKSTALYSLGVTNKYVATSYAGNAQSTTNTDKYYCNTPLEDQSTAVYAPDLEYLVGYNSDSIYVTFKIIGTQYLKRCNYIFRLGFNPADYSQTMIMSLGVNAAGAGTVFFVDDRSTAKLGENVSGTADSVVTNSKFIRYSYDGTTEGTTNNDSKNSTASSQFVAYFTVEINKANLAKVWDEVYGTAFEEVGLSNSFFACGSHNALAYFEDSPVTSLCVTQGAHAVTIDQAHNEIGTKCVLIPNVIVLGNEKEIGCNFTGHDTSDKYKVDGVENTYYHSCIYCNTVGVRTFTVDETNKLPVYDANSIDVKYLAEGSSEATCTTEGTYYKNCECGSMAKDDTAYMAVEGNTATFSTLSENAHNYVDNVCTYCGTHKYAWEGEDELPTDVQKYYATNSTPAIDGVIDTDEYGTAITVTSPRLMLNSSMNAWADTETDLTRFVIENLLPAYMEYYFAYDNDYIYVAVRDVSKDKDADVGVTIRNNYHFTLGFDPDNPDVYFSFGGYRTDGNAAGWNVLKYNKKTIDLKTYNLIDEGVFRKYEKGSTDSSSYLAYGDIGSVNGNIDQTDVAWAADIEFRISKDTLKQILKEQTGKEYSDISNSMWFSATTLGYNNNIDTTGNSQYVRWIGQGESFYDIVVFDEETATITCPAVSYCECGKELSYHKAQAPTLDAVGWNEYVSCSCGYTTYSELPKATETFKTGYDRIVITPTDLSKFSDYDSVHTDIYSTCVAVNDGEKTILMFTLDLGSLAEEYCVTLRNRISKITGVPLDNIIIAVTHNHSVPNLNEDSKWRFTTYHAMAESALRAMDDLKESTIKVGTTKTTGLAWVRNFVNDKGQFVASNGPGTDRGSVASAWDVDDVLQAVRFVRDDAKDILLINWQAHLASGTVYDKMIHSDMAGIIRDDIEAEDDDVKVAYFAGASGNVNLSAPTSADKTATAEKYGFNDEFKLFENVAHAVATLTLGIDNFRTIDSGRINIEREEYVLYVKEEISDAAYNYAAIVKANPEYAGQAFPTYAAGYLQKRYENKRDNEGKRTLDISALSFGDLALVNVPYEIFDNSGKQIKDASHFEMTLVFSNSGGAAAYMPSTEAFNLPSLLSTDDEIVPVKDVKFPESEADELANPDWYRDRPYETMATYFEDGCAEEMVAEYNRLLLNFRGHDWSAWTIVTEPTAEATGTASRSCSKGCIEILELPTLTNDNVSDVATVGKYTVSGGTYVYMYIDGTTVSISTEFVSVDITWGTMSFVYTNCMWNPEDLEYNIGEWQPAEADANVITIDNAGTVNVNVTFIYVAEDAYADVIGGSFTGVDANGTVEVVAKETENITLELMRKAIPQKGENLSVGTVTITITKAENAE